MEEGQYTEKKAGDFRKSLLCLIPTCCEKGKKHVGGGHNCPYTSNEKAVEHVKAFYIKIRKTTVEKDNSVM